MEQVFHVYRHLIVLGLLSAPIMIKAQWGGRLVATAILYWILGPPGLTPLLIVVGVFFQRWARKKVKEAKNERETAETRKLVHQNMKAEYAQISKIAFQDKQRKDQEAERQRLAEAAKPSPSELREHRLEKIEEEFARKRAYLSNLQDMDPRLLREKLNELVMARLDAIEDVLNS